MRKLLILVGVIVGLAGCSRPTTRPTVPATPAPATAVPATPTPTPIVLMYPGTVGWLGYPGGGGTLVSIALEDSAWDDMCHAQAARAFTVLARMELAGKIRTYPVGTRVKLLRNSLTGRQVAILDGDDAGRTGWVQAEFMRPDREPRPVVAKIEPKPPVTTEDEGASLIAERPVPIELTPEEKAREDRQRLIDIRKAKRTARAGGHR